MTLVMWLMVAAFAGSLFAMVWRHLRQERARAAAEAAAWEAEQASITPEERAAAELQTLNTLANAGPAFIQLWHLDPEMRRRAQTKAYAVFALEHFKREAALTGKSLGLELVRLDAARARGEKCPRCDGNGGADRRTKCPSCGELG